MGPGDNSLTQYDSLVKASLAIEGLIVMDLGRQGKSIQSDVSEMEFPGAVVETGHVRGRRVGVAASSFQRQDGDWMNLRRMYRCPAGRGHW